MKFKIDHIDDINVLYNGKGKHDKIYIVVVCHDDDWPSRWYVKGFYRARSAKSFRLSDIKDGIESPDFAFQIAGGTIQSKHDKGYDHVWDAEYGRMGLPMTKPALLTELESVLNKTGPSDRNINGTTQYECIDDFGVDGVFIPGFRYMGMPCEHDANKLIMLNDLNEPVEVDSDLFKKI